MHGSHRAVFWRRACSQPTENKGSFTKKSIALPCRFLRELDQTRCSCRFCAIRAMGRSLIHFPPRHTRSVSKRRNPDLRRRRHFTGIPFPRNSAAADRKRLREGCLRSEGTFEGDLATPGGWRQPCPGTSTEWHAVQLPSKSRQRQPLLEVSPSRLARRRRGAGDHAWRLPAGARGLHGPMKARRQVGARHMARVRGAFKDSQKSKRPTPKTPARRTIAPFRYRQTKKEGSVVTPGAPLARPARLVGQADPPPQGATRAKRGATGDDLGAKRCAPGRCDLLIAR